MKFLQPLQHLLLFFVLLFASVSTIAEIENLGGLEKLANQVKSITWKLDRGKFERDDLTKWNKISIKLSSEASVCIADREAKIKKLDESLAGLGEKTKEETQEVTSQREKLNKEKTAIEKELAQCNVYKQNGDKVSEYIAQAEKSYFKEKYLGRSPHIIKLINAYLENPFELIKDSGTFLWQHTGFQEIDKDERIFDSILIVLIFFFKTGETFFPRDV